MFAHGINFLFGKGTGFALPVILMALLLVPERAAAAQMQGAVIVTSRFANIRSGPGTKYTRLGRVYRGERYTVTDMMPDWYEISYKGRSGWIFGQLIRLEKAQPTQTEVDRVSTEIMVLNQRLDKMLERIDQANEMLARKLAPSAADSAAAMKAKAKMAAKMRKLPAGGKVSPAWLFIPGGPRLAVGQNIRGYGLLAATAGCLAAGTLYLGDYRDYRDQYRALPPETAPEEFDRLYGKSRDKRRLSNALFYTAAGLYAVNALDYFFLLPRSLAGMELRAGPAVSGRNVQLSLTRTF